jgi:hypothetical protein
MFLVLQGEVPLPHYVSTVLVLTLTPSHDLSYKPNNSVGDVTRNLRNLRPSVELREEFLYNNQV